MRYSIAAWIFTNTWNLHMRIIWTYSFKFQILFVSISKSVHLSSVRSLQYSNYRYIDGLIEEAKQAKKNEHTGS